MTLSKRCERRSNTVKANTAKGLRWAALGLLAGLSLLATSALAQAPEQVTAPNQEVPGPPTGAGVILGQARVEGSSAPVGDLPIVLYALRPDGSPGLTNTRSDADGLFTFEGISSSPDVVYLVGAEYLGIPFAQRAVFEPGNEQLIVNLALKKSIEDASTLTIPEITYKLDWVGGQLFVQVAHRIENPLEDVIYITPERRGDVPPIHAATLPPGIAEYIDGENGNRSDLIREGDHLSFWGPVYPGSQELRYGYLMAGPDSGDESAAQELEVVDELPRGAGGLRVLLAADSAPPRGSGLGEAAERVAIEGEEYASYLGEAVAPGGSVRLVLPVPESSNDLGALALSRADFWIDHDDTAIRVSAEVHVEVSAPTRLMAPPGESLLDIELPPDAEFLGLGGSTRLLGVEANGRGGLSILGPLPPGLSVIAYRYRVPVDGSARLDIRFERALDLLNVLVADNGVVIESERLHRKRPFKQGTRFYLHREAYQIGANEDVVVVLDPLHRKDVSATESQVGAFALAALAALFLVTPLRTDRGAATSTGTSGLTLEREILYESIHDLDHDFETGKIDKNDYDVLRDELRGDAIALMRKERSGAPGIAPPAPGADEARAESASGLRCPTCGVGVEAGWSFCAGCGSGLGTGQNSG